MNRKLAKANICYTHRERKIKYKDINRLFGNIDEKRKKAIEFIKREKTDKIIPIEELEKHHAALFQAHIYEGFQQYSLEDVMIDFQVDKDNEIVRAQKLTRQFGEYTLETRVYHMENYGKTWRAWAALPTREASREWD